MANVFRVVGLLAAFTLVGTFWFWLIEGWSVLDALYMTVITLTTVGYKEVGPMGQHTKVFVIVFLIAGVGLFLFGVVEIGEFILRAELRSWLGRRRMDTALKSMKNHFIICGFGRMGRTICRQLAARRLPFVAVDHNEDVLAECKQEGWAWLHGDATDDRTLADAGISRARGLAGVLNSDADNLYVVLSARLFSDKLQIIARASDEKAVDKMQRAGANRVVSLYATGAAKMAQLLVNPNVEDFFEIVSAGGSALDLAEIHVSPNSPYAGQPLAQTDLRDRGVIIVGIRRPDGELVLPPHASTVIQAEDDMIALGKSEAISNLMVDV